jgi:hypothetical protein
MSITIISTDQSPSEETMTNQQFIERLADLKTPYDDMPAKITKARRERGAYFGSDTDAEIAKDLIGDTPCDDCFEDAYAFWKLILEARALVATQSSEASEQTA